MCLTILLFTVKSVFWLSYYIVFTDNFIENYCENKDQPQLECDGKCFLSEMLDKKDTNTPKNTAVFLETELVFTTNFPETMPVLGNSITKKQTSFFYATHYNFQYIGSSFKPPASVV
ncbi:MAG: hypothetical protein R6V37_03255 [Psychroflexus maritimus]